MFDLLEIQLYPTYENIIHHMQNICEPLKELFKTTDISDMFAESVVIKQTLYCLLNYL
jgi:hypothetical protein